jgi:3-isopropylmalate/(R)-2-methylmalate dehydratase small subunit
MSARAFVFGDGIDTDVLAPGQFMRGGIEALAANCLEAVRPGFSLDISPGDIMVAGKNFGVGSSREQAAQALKYLGVAAIIAPSFAGIFYRNAINLGLPALVCENASAVRDADRIELAPDYASFTLPDRSAPNTIVLEPLPPNIHRMLRDGGLVPHLQKRFDRERERGVR